MGSAISIGLALWYWITVARCPLPLARCLLPVVPLPVALFDVYLDALTLQCPNFANPWLGSARGPSLLMGAFLPPAMEPEASRCPNAVGIYRTHLDEPRDLRVLRMRIVPFIHRRQPLRYPDHLLNRA